MQFPKSERVVYEKNPLEMVICQLRFPPILKIGVELPAIYQDKIRKEYPLFAERREIQSDLIQHLPQNIVEQLSPEILGLLSASGTRKAYEFTTADGMWTVTLTSNFMALTSRGYERWEDFKGHLQAPLETLLEVYAPSFFSRIGLRYQNVIRRSRLGLQNTAWSELLQPHIAGLFAAPELNHTVIESAIQRVEIRLQDHDSLVRIVHGLAEATDNTEACYLIDNDFFSEQRTETRDAFNRLDYFNRESRGLFRWSITERLHEAMVPRPI